MTHETHDQNNEHRGPLRFLPSPPDATTTRAVLEKLKGWNSAADWIEPGLSDELDELRAEHLRVRDQVIEKQRAMTELEARWKAEDAEHEERLRQAVREGRPADSVEDRRTPVEQDHARALDAYWAGVRVLAERAEAIVAYFREHEPELLAELRRRAGPAQEKRREAQRLLREALVEEWQIAQLGKWVKQTTDGGPFGGQPAPTPEPPPKQFSEDMLERALTRAWHREPEEPPARTWSGHQPADDGEIPVTDENDQPLGDPTGQVSELVETSAEGRPS